MKKPQKPPAFDRVWSDYLEKYNDLANRVNQKNEESEEIRRLIRKYNEQEYIHWDDLQRKNLPYDPVAFWFVIRTIRSTKYREIQIGDEKFPFCTRKNSRNSSTASTRHPRHHSTGSSGNSPARQTSSSTSSTP